MMFVTSSIFMLLLLNLAEIWKENKFNPGLTHYLYFMNGNLLGFKEMVDKLNVMRALPRAKVI